MKQYFSYFKIWLIVLVCMAAVTGMAAAKQYIDTNGTRGNRKTGEERVFDYAKVLSEEEEEKLEALIAKREKQIGSDFVVVTINEALTAQYGDMGHYYWESAMRNYADDFYDGHDFGYNTTGGDGSLFLYNFHESERGAWFSTGGKVYEHFSEEDVEDVLDAFYEKIKESPYLAYRAYIESVYREMSGRNNWVMKILVVAVPLLVCVFFISANIKPKAGEKTVTSRTYVNGGKAKMKDERDIFLRRSISQRRIETSSGGSGRSGGGGGHRSSGGFSHGGGGRRG